MRIKTFFVFLTFVVIFFFTLVILAGNETSSSLKSFVSEFNTFQDNLRDLQEKRFQADERNLQHLGFTTSPRLYPENIWPNSTLPVIVTVLHAGQDELGIEFSRNMAQMAPGHSVLMYDVGLTDNEQLNVASVCNTSRCQLIKFDLTLFPAHVQTILVHSVRPLVIQHALNRAGAIFYIDTNLRLASHFTSLLGQKPVGVFSTRQAVSSLTHPSMMDYFRTSVESFQFLPMVELSRLLLWNTREVHYKIMLPWIQCVLTPECLEPVGAQSQGCRFNKKPQYRYSGCHGYDASAFNIALGLAFDFDDGNYTFPIRDTLFVAAANFHDQSEPNVTLS